MSATEGQRQLELALEAVATDQEEWLDYAEQAINHVASVIFTRNEKGEVVKGFTTDAVWRLLQDRGINPPRDPRAMGAAVRRALKAGRIEATGEYRKTERTSSHRRPCAVYALKTLDSPAE